MRTWKFPSVRVMMRVENNNVSGQNHDPEQIDLIDLLVQLWRGKMTIIISVIVAIALAIGYLAVAKEKWTSTAIITQPDVGQIAGYNNAMNVIDVIIGGDDVKNEKPERGRGFRGGIDRNDREGRVYEL